MPSWRRQNLYPHLGSKAAHHRPTAFVEDRNKRTSALPEGGISSPLFVGDGSLLDGGQTLERQQISRTLFLRACACARARSANVSTGGILMRLAAAVRMAFYPLPVPEACPTKRLRE